MSTVTVGLRTGGIEKAKEVNRVPLDELTVSRFLADHGIVLKASAWPRFRVNGKVWFTTDERSGERTLRDLGVTDGGSVIVYSY